MRTQTCAKDNRAPSSLFLHCPQTLLRIHTWVEARGPGPSSPLQSPQNPSPSAGAWWHSGAFSLLPRDPPLHTYKTTVSGEWPTAQALPKLGTEINDTLLARVPSSRWEHSKRPLSNSKVGYRTKAFCGDLSCCPEHLTLWSRSRCLSSGGNAKPRGAGLGSRGMAGARHEWHGRTGHT